MLIFALNCGSSSLKSAVIDTERRRHVVDVRVQQLDTATLSATVGRVLQQLRERSRHHGPPGAIVHRVVHGGERFVQPTKIDDGVLAELDELSHLAPLHNPPALAAIRRAREVYPQTAHVAVFDTAFHATLPPRAREYALPEDLRRRFGIRRYGFHGISHAHVMHAVAAELKAPAEKLRIVSCHLGNGASVTAIEHGRSVDTSMGMTPLEGLVMGTRAGDLDPGILLELVRSGSFAGEALDALLNRQSGLTGLTGTNDMRDIASRAADGDEECRRALALYAYRVRKYIGAYAAAMGGVDVIAFTGGVGENSAEIRQACVEQLDFLGAKIMVVRADEELAMAMEAAAMLGSTATSSS
ncbi:MAG TPA: acetate/propionate family kinase [Steroidobacteraceae bacterium]|nr:acetate/propionate family kinase [Steroidobacteraceae bacterium]